MSDEVTERVRRIVAEQAMVEPETITCDTTPEELGLDSLGMVEIVFGIEEAFDVQVPFNANDPSDSNFDITSFGAIADGVKRLVAEQASAT